MMLVSDYSEDIGKAGVAEHSTGEALSSKSLFIFASEGTP